MHRSSGTPPVALTLFLGCPVWACEHWRGTLYTRRATRNDWLKQYSSVFRTVEGNSTFYALPSPDTAQRWVDSCDRAFRFALKFPRSITHDRRLVDAERETADFVEILEILDTRHRLGPSFLQLPPDFGPDRFAVLERYLRALPDHLPWAVEVRQQAWYDSGTNEQRLDDLLRELQMDKVLFDSRALFSGPPSDDIERLSQQRKPRTPIRQTVTGGNPFLRLVGRNCLDDAVPWIREWAPVIAGWLQQGLRPWIFAHAPDDRYAPEFARRIHNHVRQLVPELPEMVPWPGEVEAQASRSAGRIVQQTLFGEDE